MATSRLHKILDTIPPPLLSIDGLTTEVLQPEPDLEYQSIFRLGVRTFVVAEQVLCKTLSCFSFYRDDLLGLVLCLDVSICPRFERGEEIPKGLSAMAFKDADMWSAFIVNIGQVEEEANGPIII